MAELPVAGNVACPQCGERVPVLMPHEIYLEATKDSGGSWPSQPSQSPKFFEWLGEQQERIAGECKYADELDHYGHGTIAEASLAGDVDVRIAERIRAARAKILEGYGDARKAINDGHLRGGDLIMMRFPFKDHCMQISDNLTAMADAVERGEWTQ